ncbi:hypothetical protein IHE45_04G015700 [Dioscorea alata]|uniref:Uncharacterized protein n=1 Tax=Dioscorea alata TaxID=55571 RepID=A0ACB7WBB2_DIOAL|nr:hypothetical protein IHE45_04G015700 [Dioscorea alata]
MMDKQRTLLLLLISIYIIVVLSMERVDAARPTPEGSFDESGLLSYPLVYEKARSAVYSWMAMLPAGPSDRGAGH